MLKLKQKKNKTNVAAAAAAAISSLYSAEIFLSVTQHYWAGKIYQSSQDQV